jgi:uncharacterized SAM-binding protein YcdF (DUF218 family)
VTPGIFGRWLVGLVLSLAAIPVLILGVAAFQVWHVGHIDDRAKTDAIVVMGASQFNGRPSEVFKARLDHAAELVKAGVAPRIITTGGSRRGDQYTEGEAGARYLTKRAGVADSSVLWVGEGSDTLVSVKAAAQIMKQHGWRTAVVVTDPWHELRARTMLSDQGISATTSPAHTGPAMQGGDTERHYLTHETLGYLFYSFFHRSSESGTRAI